MPLLALLLAAAPEVEALNARGLEAFERKQYEQGIEQFEKAYALSPLPGFLYNLALGNRLLGRCAESAELYRRYLAADPKVKNRKKVEARLDEMERCAEGQKPKPAPEPVDEAPAVLEPVPAPPPPPPPVVTVEPEPKRLSPLPWIVAALSVASGGVATGLLVSAKGDFDRFSATCAPACLRAEWQPSRSKELAGWVLVGTAATALVVAIVLWALG
ncbi:MAG: hypothetical protein JNK82_19510 [Myxococcaceae bacterium]|nr:hypothetical protein [Myxococcaceae bacterium]